jgi:2-octaprenyl-6-methoxyphenol hydroxylase
VVKFGKDEEKTHPPKLGTGLMELGIGADDHDFLQTLFVARVRAERAPDGTAYERFGPHGPTALLPRGDGHFGVVHGVPRDEADAVAASS